MPSLSSHSLFVSLLGLKFFVALTFFVSLINANTEIRNFRIPRSSASSSLTTFAGEDTNVSLVLNNLEKINATHNEWTFRVWPASVGTPTLHEVCEAVISTANSERSVNLKLYGDASQVKPKPKGGKGMETCANEIWLELDFSDSEWERYEMFTIRISWPAFYPTDFDITLYSSEEFVFYIRSRFALQEDVINLSNDKMTLEASRLRFARIRLVDTGIRTPSRYSSTAYPNDKRNEEERQDSPEQVPFTIILEPLLFGVLPVTLLPTIYFSIPILVGVLYAFPYVMQYLECVADEARKELSELEREKERKER